MPEFVIVAVVLVALVLVFGAVKVVRRDQAWVIERFGRFRKVAGTGLNVLIPVIDRIRARVDLREQVLACPPTQLRTAEDGTVTVAMQVCFKVVDAHAVSYGNADWLPALEQSAKARLADEIRHMNPAEAVRSGRATGGSLRAALDAEAGQWGVAVTSVQLTFS